MPSRVSWQYCSVTMAIQSDCLIFRPPCNESIPTCRSFYGILLMRGDFQFIYSQSRVFMIFSWRTGKCSSSVLWKERMASWSSTPGNTEKIGLKIMGWSLLPLHLIYYSFSENENREKEQNLEYWPCLWDGWRVTTYNAMKSYCSQAVNSK